MLVWNLGEELVFALIPPCWRNGADIRADAFVELQAASIFFVDIRDDADEERPPNIVNREPAVIFCAGTALDVDVVAEKLRFCAVDDGINILEAAKIGFFWGVRNFICSFDEEGLLELQEELDVLSVIVSSLVDDHRCCPFSMPIMGIRQVA